MKIFATLSNGNQAQIELFGDITEILKFIDSYEGGDLGNDIILEDFVVDFKQTGVVIEA